MFKISKSIIKSIGKAVRHDPEVRKIIERYPRFFHFVKKRLTPDEKFGLHLTLGIFFTAFFVFLFFGVLQDLIGREALVQSDLRIINLVQIFRTPRFNDIMLFITYLGRWQVVFLGAAFTAIVLALYKNWRYLMALSVSVAGGEIFVWLVKILIKRPRPPLVNALAPETSYSFPSGHSFVAISFYGLLIYFLMRFVKSKALKTVLTIFGVFIILAIGFSRIYLGAHWPSDVLASYASGAAWLTVLITSIEIRKKFKNNEKRKPYFKKSVIVYLSLLFFLLWASYVLYFFKSNPIKSPAKAKETAVIISDKNITQELFANFSRTSEDISGGPMEPINIIVVGSETDLEKNMKVIGWVKSDSPNISNLWHLLIAALFNKPYPNAPGIPSFWNALPNDLSFAQPTADNTVHERHHIHFWKTPFKMGKSDVWFGTAHFDKEIKIKFNLIPVHVIDPAIDKERDKIKEDFAKKEKIQAIQTLQVTEPTLGENQAGDQFFTDGKAYLIFLKK